MSDLQQLNENNFALHARCCVVPTMHDMKVTKANTRFFDRDGKLGIRDGVTKCNSDACNRPKPFFGCD